MKDTDPGFCPHLCGCKGWEICEHFVGYSRDGKMAPMFSPAGKPGIIPVAKEDVQVNTGVSVRVYRGKS